MKNISKSIVSKMAKILGVFILIGVTIYSAIQTVNAAPSTITFASSIGTITEAYLSETYVTKNVLTDGTYTYCLNRFLKNPTTNMKATLVGEADAGFAYILQNGYPNKSITGDNNKDYYITQTAMWWYLDETTGSTNLSNAFKETASDPYGIRTYIKALVTGAVSAKNTGYASAPTLNLSVSSDEMSLSSDKKYFVSEVITGKATNITGEYKVSVTSGPTGTLITDKDGNQKSSFAAGETFLVKVPFESLTSTSEQIKIKATASQTINKAYRYSTGDSAYQDAMPALLYPVTTEVSASLTLNISTSKLTIVKLDEATDNTLAGAKLQLLDADGNEITSWTSTTKAHVISNLPDGIYYLKEVEAPTGYKLSKESIKIEINEKNRDVEIKMYNTAKQVVVNIVKIDEDTGLPLAGAVLVIKDKDGKEIDRFTSTTDPYVLLDLEDGTYTIEEESAPEGYVKSDEVVTFTIDDENQTHQIEFKNDKICGPGDEYGPNGEKCNEVSVPNTSTTSGMFITILGGILIIGTIGFVYYNGKKEKQN